MAMGGVGAIAGLANVLGAEMCDLYRLCVEEKWSEAAKLQRALVQPNIMVTAKYGVTGMKATLDWIGMYGGPPRSPLLPLPPADVEIIKKTFVENGFFADM